MKRRTFKLRLLDQNEYAFSERNMEDADYSYLQEKIRADKVIFIQDYIKSEELQMPLLMQEMRALYGWDEFRAYIRSHEEVHTSMVYDSFKLENPTITFEQFKGLVNKGLVLKLINMINELENYEDVTEKDIAVSLGVPEKKVISWRNEQPQVYNALKKSIKKNSPPNRPQEKLPRQ